MKKHVQFFEDFINESHSEIVEIPTVQEGRVVRCGVNVVNNEFIEFVAVEDLLKFREFDRLVTPKFSKEESIETIDYFKNTFLEEGIDEPLIIKYYQPDSMILLTEGNHRLNAAVELNMPYLPVTVLRSEDNVPEDAKGKAIPVPGYEQDRQDYVPTNLKPSDIGLPVIY